MIINGIVGASTDEDLIKAIGEELANLHQAWHHVKVISVSHSVGGSDAWFWTALITCDVEDEIRSEHATESSALVERVIEHMR